MFYMDKMETLERMEAREDLAVRVRVASLEAQVTGLAQQLEVESKIQNLLKARNSQLEARYASQRRVSEAARNRAIGSVESRSAALAFQLSRSKIDIYRWRQRSALLKVRQSSAREDADRAERLCSANYRLSAVGAAAASAYGQASRLASRQGQALRSELEEAQLAASRAQDLLAEQRLLTQQVVDRAEHAEHEAISEKERRAAAEEAKLLAEGRIVAAEAALREHQTMSSDRSIRLATDLSAVKRELASRGAVEALLASEGERRTEAELRAARAEAQTKVLEAKNAELQVRAREREEQVKKLEEEITRLRQGGGPTPPREVATALRMVSSFVDCLAHEGEEGLDDCALAVTRGEVAEVQERTAQEPLSSSHLLPRQNSDAASQEKSIAANKDTKPSKARGGPQKNRAATKKQPAGRKEVVVPAHPPGASTAMPGSTAMAVTAALADPEPQAARISTEAAPEDFAIPDAISKPPSPVPEPKRRPSGRRAAGQAKVNLAASVWGEGESPAVMSLAHGREQDKENDESGKTSESNLATGAETDTNEPPQQQSSSALEAALQPRAVDAARKLADAPLPLNHPALERPALVTENPAASNRPAPKRKLLGVSAGNVLPASALFGANFKVPRLAGKR